MGNFEKLVVVAVLFVAAVVLAISFNRGGEEGDATDPMQAAQRVLEEDEGLAGLPPEDAFAPGALLEESPAPSLLLNAGTEAPLAAAAESGAAPAGLQPSESFAPASLTLEPRSDASQRILADTIGLRPSFADQYMVYRVAEGDTWTGLAQRFYQDGQYTRNLMRANDDMAQLVPGNDILVPIYDELSVESEPGFASSGLQSESIAAGSALSAGAAPRTSEPAPAAPARTSTGPALEYEVKPGDTLSDISLAVFGTATRWKELLTANSDKLRTPESLQVGMKLKIPEGGKLPAAGAAKPAPKAVAKKPEAKPASATTAPAPKKKTVL